MLEIAEIMFDLSNLSEIDVLRLNAEFLDSIIDLFGDENLADIERSLNFYEKIQALGEKFYSKVIEIINRGNVFKKNLF